MCKYCDELFYDDALCNDLATISMDIDDMYVQVKSYIHRGTDLDKKEEFTYLETYGELKMSRGFTYFKRNTIKINFCPICGCDLRNLSKKMGFGQRRSE